MATRDRRLDRGRYRATQSLVRVGDELRAARVSANLTQGELGAIVAISTSEISRIELGRSPRVPYAVVALIAAALGLDVPLRTYAFGDAVRDLAQLALLGRFRARLPSLRHVAEVGVARPGDPRAWDEVAMGIGWSLPVEAESRLRDVQAIERRVSLKLRDSAFDRVVLLVADTRHNRQVLQLAAGSFEGAFPVSGRRALADLEAGRCPPGSAIIML